MDPNEPEASIPDGGRRRTIAAIAITAVVLFGLVPWSLGAWAGSLLEGARTTLRACEPSFDRFARADSIRIVQGYFPGFGGAAQRGRSSILYAVENSVAVCSIDNTPPPAIHDGFLAYVEERSDVLSLDEGPHDAVAERLHSLGLDAELVRLAQTWPPTGVKGYVARAYFYLGRLDELRAHVDNGTYDGGADSLALSPGAVLCLAGEFAGGVRGLRALADGLPRESFRGQRAVVLWAECAAAGGLAEELDEALKLAPHDLGIYHRANAAAERGDLKGALELLDRAERGDALDLQILRAWVLTRAGEHSELLALLDATDGELKYEIDKSEEDRSLNEQVYNEIFFPRVDEARLEAIASGLIEALPELATPPDSEADTDAIPGEPPANIEPRYQGAERRAKRAITQIHRRLAIAHGVRWDDPGMEAHLAKARIYQADPAPTDSIAALFASFHGGLLEEATNPYTVEPIPAHEVPLRFLNPSRSNTAAGHVYRIVHDPDLSTPEKMILLARQTQESEVHPLLMHLTMRIIAAEKLGEDASAMREQLSDFRSLIESQTSPRLLRFSY